MIIQHSNHVIFSSHVFVCFSIKKITFNNPLYIRVDKERLIQVMINLLSNAIKYTPEGGVIIVSVQPTQEKLLIKIIDNGYGIPHWAKEKIFQNGRI